MLPTTCATREELSDLSLGKLPPQRLDEVASHLEACSTCQIAFASLDTVDDTLFTALQPGGGDTSLDAESALQQGLARIRELGATLGSQVVGEEDLGTIRDYRLLAKLGAGGMGTVYKALHMQLEKVVALKLLPADRMHPEAVARFKREMKAVGKLHHAHIVQAFDAGEHDGRHFLVMELVDGADLAAIVRGHGPLKIADACEAARQTALALEYVRQHGMVHRDIKPSNLVINTAGQVKVLDLGLARLHDPTNEGDELTSASQAMGTADYLAPEQIGDSHGVDIRADIYALGCTLYKLLTGDAPYADKRTAAQKMVAHLSQPFPDVRAARPDVPAGLKAVLDRLVAKEPSERYATPAEVATALAPFCTGHDLAVLARVSEHEAFDPPAPTLASATGDPSLDDTSTLLAGGAAKPQAKEGIVAQGPSLAVSGDWFSGRKLILALAAGGLALLLGIVVLIQTREGTLVLTVEGPKDGIPPVIKVDGKEESATIDKDGKTYRIRVKPGTHELLVTTPDGIEFGVDDKFSMSWGGETKLTARLERNEADPIGAADADRRAAEWVLSLGGTVRVLYQGQLRDIAAASALPRESFAVVRFDLKNQKPTDDGLEILLGLKLLSNPIFNNTPIGDRGVAVLAKVPSIEYLALGQTRVTDAGLAELTSLTALKTLRLDATEVGDAGLAHLSELQLLEQVHLKGTRVSESGVRKLAAAKPRCKIEWDGGVIEPTIVADADRRAAQWAQSLGGLIHIVQNGQEKQIKHDEPLPAGEFVLIRVAVTFLKVDDAAMKNLRGCRNLRMLDLNGCPVSNVGLSELGDVSNIWSLYLGDTNVTDDGLARFATAKNLQELAIGGTRITEHGLGRLDLRELTNLSLAKCAVSDDMLDLIQKCPKLFQLDLRGTRLDDADLARLATLQSLRHLLLHETKATEAGVRKIAEALPACRIAWDGGVILPKPDLEADRRAAQWVLSNGGVIQYGQNGEYRQIDSLSALPDGRFELTSVSMPFNEKFNAAGDAGLAHFRGCRNLVMLDLNGNNASDAGMAAFQDCHKLQSLWLPAAGLTDAALAHFKHCQLATLSLGSNKFSDKGLAQLDLSKLGHLGLYGSVVDDAMWAHFHTRCPELSHIDLRMTKLDDEKLPQLYRFKKLTRVQLLSTQVTQAGVANLAAALPGARIEWDGGVMEPTLQERQAAEWVLSVGGHFDREGGPQVRKVEDLPKEPFRIYSISLRHVSLKDEDLEHLRGLTRVVHIDLMNTGISNGALAHLESIPSLESLDLTGTHVTAAAIDSLKKLPALRGVQLGGTKLRPGQYQRLIELPGLKEIGLGNDRDFGDEEARSLSKLPPVEVLNIGHTSLGDAGLREVVKLTQLQGLRLESSPQLTAEGMAALAGLTRLRQLFIGHTEADDETAAVIGTFPDLDTLMADETQIGDPGLTHIAKARKLKFLTLQRTKVTEAGVTALKKELPECRIVWDGGVLEPAMK